MFAGSRRSEHTFQWGSGKLRKRAMTPGRRQAHALLSHVRIEIGNGAPGRGVDRRRRSSEVVIL